MARAYCDNCLKYTRKYVFLNKILADYLCNDCEKYLCLNCITRHTDHIIFSVKEKTNKIKLDKFCDNMMEQLTLEGDQTLDKFKQEQIHMCDVVNVVGGRHTDDSVRRICMLRESKKWAVTHENDKCIKVFNINKNQSIGTLHLASIPLNITEVPSTDPSQSLIAVSLLFEKQINIMNINSDPAHVFSSINVRRTCYDFAYCENKFIIRCGNYLDGKWRNSIHVMDLSGEIINIIDLQKLHGIHVQRSYVGDMCIHPESKTIYLCHYDEPPCVISLSLDGQVLHSVMFTDMNPRIICVDRDQTVYVMGDTLPLYKLSADLSQTEKIIDDEFSFANHSHYFTSIACHADTFYFVRSDGQVVIIRRE